MFFPTGLVFTDEWLQGLLPRFPSISQLSVMSMIRGSWSKSVKSEEAEGACFSMPCSLWKIQPLDIQAPQQKGFGTP